MKIRTGFVSNSSSSSFCIYGIYISPKDILESKIEELYEKNKDESWCNSIEDIKRSLENELGEWTEQYGPPNEWENSEPLGSSPGSMPDNMLVGDWKKKVKEEIATWVGEKLAEGADWIVEGWYNG